MNMGTIWLNFILYYEQVADEAGYLTAIERWTLILKLSAMTLERKIKAG